MLPCSLCSCFAQASPIAKNLSNPYAWPPGTLEHFYKGPKTRSRRAAYSFPITQASNYTDPNLSPTKTYDSYTWPDSVAPSKEVTPVPLKKLPRVKKPLPKSDRVLRSHVQAAKKDKKFMGCVMSALYPLC